VPGLDWAEAQGVKTSLFVKFGLEEYVNCVMAEPYRRQIPQAMRPDQLSALAQVYEKWAPRLFEIVMPQIEAPLQPLNKESRLGWPAFNRPESKKEHLKIRFPAYMADLEGELRGAYVIQNVRLQEESPSKTRDYTYLTAEGKTYQHTLVKTDRMVATPLGPMIAARARLVFNYPEVNLLKQIGDSALHNVYMKYDLWHHNMYSVDFSRRLPRFLLSFDIKHMERFTAAVILKRAEILGGNYERVERVFLALPSLCPSDARNKKDKVAYLVSIVAPFLMQFGSGNSAVASSQKEAFFCPYCEFVEQYFNMTADEAAHFVLRGGDSRLRIINYGDDNLIGSDDGSVILDECFEFLSRYFEAEKDDVPSFLGFKFSGERAKMELKLSSYLFKTYMNERPPGGGFRKYPFFGWVEKRKVYAAYGDPRIATEVFPTEDALLERTSTTWGKVLEEAQVESLELAAKAGHWMKPAWLLQKDWLMTAQEKIALGLFEGLEPQETRPLLLWLFGDKWSKEIHV